LERAAAMLKAKMLARLGSVALLPSIDFHHESRHWVNFFLLKYKAFALIPAPGLVVLAYAPQPDFVRHKLPRKGKQPFTKPLALIVRGDEQLAKATVGQTQGKHCSQASTVVGDKEAPAVRDLAQNARAQIGQ